MKLDTNATPKLFPQAMRSLRQRSGLLQKSVAAELGLDPAVMCAIEKGVRAPLSDERIRHLVEKWSLDVEERVALLWAARHDRLLSQLELSGAGSEELQLISVALTAWNLMGDAQRHGWLTNVRRLADSAALMRFATSAPQTKEDAMS